MCIRDSEIRNPLAVMRTGLEVALRKDRTASEYRGLLRENAVSYTHLRAHETVLDIVCRLLLEKKKHK